jgi:hypothetical protein
MDDFFRFAFFQLVLDLRKTGFTEIPAVLVKNTFFQNTLEFAKIALMENGFDGC